MRATPRPKTFVCKMCGKEFVSRSHIRLYCDECRVIAKRECKKRYEKKKYPNRIPLAERKQFCCVCGEPFSSHYDGKPYCNKHYLRMYFNGTLELKQRERTNEYIIEGDVSKIVTKAGEVILADAEDVDLLKRYSWCVSKQGYAVANIDGIARKMNRYVLGFDECNGKTVDHINRNKLDNRKSNLRFATQAENSRNCNKTVGSVNPYVGVRKVGSGRYVARITYNRKGIHIGTFDTLSEAIEARKQGELKYHKEFAQHLSAVNE